MNKTIGGKNLFARVEVVAAAEIGDSSACLHQDKCAGCNVPRTEQTLHARFSSAGCDIAQLGCTCSDKSESARITVESVDEFCLEISESLGIIRKAKFNECIVYLVDVCAVNLLAVKICLAAFVSPEKLISCTFVNHTYKQFLL